MLTQDDTMQYPADNSAPRTQARQRGTSLVEVLVVLVILVLGIFSIARLFPGGFFTIRSAENNTFADHLAQAQLETLKQNSSFLLNGVYMYTSDGNLDPYYRPADLSGTSTSPYVPTLANGTMGAPDATLNDINKARYISGENFTVPASRPNGVPIHVLNFGPVHIPDSARTGTSLPSPDVPGFGLVSTPWTAQTGSSQSSPSDLGQQVDSPTDLLQQGKPSYLVDYANGKIAVPSAAYPQNFILVVTTVSPNTTYIVHLVVPASNSSAPYNGGWFAPGDTNLAYAPTSGANVAPPVGSVFVPGSAILTRPLKCLSLTQQDTLLNYPNLSGQADPYTYELAVGASTNLGGDEYMGALALNPHLAGQQISATYLTVDWHIIHEDIDVPAINTTFGTDTSVTNAPIRLTLNHLRRVGDVLPDQTVSQGLFPGAVPQYDIVLLDTDTGQMQGLYATDLSNVFDADNNTGPPTGTTQFSVSYQNGRITLPSAYQANFTGSHKHLRVFYEGDYGWAVALQKNPSLYQLVTGAGAVPGVGQFIVDPTNPTHLVFPESDFGQSVAVDRISYTDKNGAAQQVATASGAITTDFGGTNYVDLSPFLSNVDTAKPVTFGPVRGISARAVVIWKERDQWKSRTVSTILNRS